MAKGFKAGGGGKLPTPEEIGAMSMELLWENASPTSVFAEQLITLDLSKYGMAAIECAKSTNVGKYNTLAFAHKRQGTYGVMTEAATVITTREFEVRENGVYFTDAHRMSYGQSYYVNNSDLIPSKIYGVKGVSA